MSKLTSIFVVDADKSAREGLTRLLNAGGFNVRSFASIKEFLNAIAFETSGCLILDADMPGLSEEELQSDFMARGKHMPIILITAKDVPESRHKAHAIRAAGFFRKPVDGIALLDAITWELSRDSANRQ
jgi:FixJ family two-component response regulator